MSRKVQTFLLFEVSAFAVAALIHYGVLLPGHQHLKAAIAESMIALVLAAGLALTLAHAGCPRKVGLAAQGVALLGTCVGLFTIAIGIGPQTAADLWFHAAIVAVLACGLIVAWGAHTPMARESGDMG